MCPLGAWHVHIRVGIQLVCQYHAPPKLHLALLLLSTATEHEQPINSADDCNPAFE